MIYLYSGTPGSGKSLHTARVIYYTLKRGLPIIANFDVDTAKIKKATGEFLQVNNDKLTPKLLIEYSRNYFKNRPVKEGEITLIIDEAQIMFNAREWNLPNRKEWLQYFTQHRKYGYDIILIAQFDRMLDRQVRSLIEYEQIHRKVSNFGWKGKVLSLVMGGHTFVAVKVWYPMKEKVGSEFFHATKKFYSIYDTYNSFASANSGDIGAPQVAEAERIEVEQGESLLDNTNT